MEQTAAFSLGNSQRSGKVPKAASAQPVGLCGLLPLDMARGVIQIVLETNIATGQQEQSNPKADCS